MKNKTIIIIVFLYIIGGTLSLFIKTHFIDKFEAKNLKPTPNTQNITQDQNLDEIDSVTQKPTLTPTATPTPTDSADIQNSSTLDFTPEDYEVVWAPKLNGQKFIFYKPKGNCPDKPVFVYYLKDNESEPELLYKGIDGDTIYNTYDKIVHYNKRYLSFTPQKYACGSGSSGPLLVIDTKNNNKIINLNHNLTELSRFTQTTDNCFVITDGIWAWPPYVEAHWSDHKNHMYIIKINDNGSIKTFDLGVSKYKYPSYISQEDPKYKSYNYWDDIFSKEKTFKDALILHGCYPKD